MMGTSLLSMPWAIEQAGLVAGLALILVMAGLCFYTAYCLLIVYNVYGKSYLEDFICLNSISLWCSRKRKPPRFA